MNKVEIRENPSLANRQEKFAAKFTRRHFLGTLGTIVTSSPYLLANPLPDSQRPILLENAYLRYAISPEGENLSFFDKSSGREYIQRAPRSWFVTLKQGEKTFMPSACEFSGNRIVTSFQGSGTTIVCSVKDHGQYFTFEVESLDGWAGEELRLLNLHLTGLPRLGRMANVAWGDQFGAAVMALNLQTNAGCAKICDTDLRHFDSSEQPQLSTPFWWDRELECHLPVKNSGPTGEAVKEVVLFASCYSKLTMKGASVALVGCPASDFRGVLKRVTKEVGFIQSDLGGAWALDAPENFNSYLFCTASENDVDEWIALAKSGGFGALLIDHIGPHGQYIPDAKKFPHGLEGVKQIVGRIHASGLKAGWHTLSFAIEKNDPWVSPVPHPDLAARFTLTLASDLSKDATFIPTVESPQDLPTDTGFWFRGGMDVMVGGEIFTYKGLKTSPPCGLTDCVRGAYGTRASDQKKGATLRNLQEVFGHYVPASDSQLIDDMENRFAEIIRTCEFDAIYLDGLDGADVFAGYEWSWHYGAKFALSIYKRAGRRLGIEASAWLHHNWPITSGLGAWDGNDRDPKPFIDLHVWNNQQLGDLIPTQLGWWKLNHDQGRLGFATTPEVIEYLCARSLGTGQPISVNVVTPALVKADPRWAELIAIMGRYERLRLKRQLPDAAKAHLTKPGKEFMLRETTSGEPQFVPVAYDEHKVVALDGRSNVWTVSNPFPSQQAKLRIRTLFSVAPYRGSDARMISDFSSSDEFTLESSRQGISMRLNPSTAQVKAGKSSGRLVAKSTLGSRRGAWAMVGKQFSPGIDLSTHPALGVWVFGDGKGEILNLQLLDVNGPNVEVDDHYVIVDFDGWRYFELVEPEAGRWSDYLWPYQIWLAAYGEPVDFTRIRSFNLYYNNLPPGEPVACWLSPVKSLPLVEAPLKNPRLTIGGKTIQFPVELKRGCYLEYNSADDCSIFDPNGALLEKCRPEGGIPLLGPGANRVEFSCCATQGINPRALVSVISSGLPLAGLSSRWPN